MILIITLSSTSILLFKNYNIYKAAETKTYQRLVNGIIDTGILSSKQKLSICVELAKGNSPDERGSIEVWLLEVAANLGVASENASIASTHWRLTLKQSDHVGSTEIDKFLQTIQYYILDMVRTEKDFEKWKNTCYQLYEIFGYIGKNLDRSIFEEGKYSEVYNHWRDLLEQSMSKISDSDLKRLIVSYFV